MESIKIFDKKFEQIVQTSLSNISIESRDESPEKKKHSSPSPDKIPIVDAQESPPKALKCLCCRLHFDDKLQHREHFKLDWHRYNLKKSLASKDPITEEKFLELTGNDDVSSISGSDTETEVEESTDNYITAKGKIFLQNEQGTVFSMYACLLYSKKEDLNNEMLLKRLKDCAVNNKKWTVLLLGGGHFAGAVFNGETPILHKTFHCYTVRAGQGGAQSSRDNKSGSSHPKSAGASLRRYNEQALVQHVRDIVDLWKNEIANSSLIIYRAAGPYNRSVLFGGNAPPLDRNDPRLRTIPFSTRRATFAEVQRVHSLLLHAQIYESSETALEHFHKQKAPEETTKRNKSRAPNINRCKSRELPNRDLPPQESSSSSDSETELETNLQEINLNDSLKQFEDSLTPEQRKAKKKKPKKSKTKKLKEQEEKRKKELEGLIVRGDIGNYEKFLENDKIDEILDDKGNTALHIAALNEHPEFLEFLLQKGANLCAKNTKQQTPYTCTDSKEIRETLRSYARENPDKFNYNKAQIPTNTLNPDEMAEKRKAIRRIKKEKEKLKKKENEIKKQEELEKDRFLQLSDREKRALAAERRILSKSGAVLSRCFQCAIDITGKVPFEYNNNRFCSVECLKAHRLSNPIILS